MTGQPPIAYDAYEQLADRYAAQVDHKPHNAYYERPAMLALMPPILRSSRVLDAGCGSGLYAAWLLDQGATVTGLDASPAMLGHARTRTGGRADLRLHDLSQPMPFLPDAAFDLVVSSLVFHYLEDWRVPLAEFHRVLRPDGLLLFSVGHPMLELRYSPSGAYFQTELTGASWRGFGGEPVYVPFFRRPLTAMTESLYHAGFVVERLIEPQPTEEFRQADPEDYAQLLQMPGFLCFRARRARE